MPANIERTCNVCDTELHIYGDHSVLQQALMNLLNNARDAVAEVSNPHIDCSMRPFTATETFKKRHPELEVEDFAEISVRDNGSGIEEGQLDKIFEPFFTTKEVGKGTGLGLAMVFGAVKAHGGAIEVETEFGKGTAFHIFLPIVEASVGGTKSKLALLRGEGESILLVDDDELLRKATEEILLTLGYKVSVASDGMRAFDIFKDHVDEIDLVLTDVVMPKVGGIDLLKSIRKAGNKTPVIFMTGYDDALPKPGDELVNETPVIRKPFSAEQLSQTIRKMIEHN